MEEWQDIPYLPTHQANRKTGQILNKKLNYILKGYLGGNGYRIYNISKNKYMGHRLVFHTFSNTRDYNLDIDHINGNKEDNRYSNLQMLSKKEHVKKTMSSSSYVKKRLFQESLRKIKRSDGVEFSTIKEVLDNVPQINLYGMYSALTKGHKHGGYYWEWVNILENEDEEWRDISSLKYKDFNFKDYKVSCTGKIYRPRSKTITAGNKGSNGYLRVKIGVKYMYVHVLICLAFHGDKPGEKYTVDHIDRNKTNNHKDNLRWASPKVQMKFKSKEILQLNEEQNVIQSYQSIREATRKTKIHRWCIVCALKNGWKGGGYFWKYK